MAKEPSCRVCGCTQNNACFDEKRGHGCHWSARGLCNVCAEKAKAIKLASGPKFVIGQLRINRCYERESAKPGFDGGGLRHSSLLANAGLVDRDYDVKRARMVYWLTPLGREVARRRAS